MILAVRLTVLCESQEQALRVVEVLSRPLVGLALDNLHGSLNVTPTDVEEEEDRK